MVKLELQNGNTVDLSLNFLALAKLKNLDEKAYTEYFDALNGKKDKIFTNVQVVYTAYLCALIKTDSFDDSRMTYNDFIGQLPEDTFEILSLGDKLLNPKKAKGSAERSSAQAKGASEAV